MLVPLLSQATQSGYIAYDAGQLDVMRGDHTTCGRRADQFQVLCEAAEGRRLAEAADQLKTRFC